MTPGSAFRRALRAGLLALAAPVAVHGGLPAMQTEGSVTYVCGGVGADERRAMRSLEPQANLALLFVTQKRGGYLADATVTISDGRSTRFVTVADGPSCLLRLPAGSYRVTGAIGPTTRSAQVKVGAQAGKAQRIVFSFPGEPWDGVWASPEEKQQASAPDDE